MTDSLRTRIADCCGVTSVDLSDSDRYAVADAVIRELGLTRRTGQGPFSNQVWYQTDWTIE